MWMDGLKLFWDQMLYSVLEVRITFLVEGRTTLSNCLHIMQLNRYFFMCCLANTLTDSELIWWWWTVWVLSLHSLQTLSR